MNLLNLHCMCYEETDVYILGKPVGVIAIKMQHCYARTTTRRPKYSEGGKCYEQITGDTPNDAGDRREGALTASPSLESVPAASNLLPPQ